MTSSFPTNFSEIGDWAARNGFPRIEGRTRFVQFAILRAITQIEPFQRSLVFKGGNALDFVWLPNRSTLDLDFSFDSSEPTFAPSIEAIGELLRAELESDEQFSDILFHVNRVRQQPQGVGRAFVTFEARIGYALPDETALRKRMASGHPRPDLIPVEMSTNERVCDSRDIEMASSSNPYAAAPLRTSSPKYFARFCSNRFATEAAGRICSTSQSFCVPQRRSIARRSRHFFSLNRLGGTCPCLRRLSTIQKLDFAPTMDTRV